MEIPGLTWVGGADNVGGMYLGLVTTGLRPLFAGSTEVFQAQGFLNGFSWDLTGGSGSLKLQPPPLPDGTPRSPITIAGTISGGCCLAPWTVVGISGAWYRQWTLTDVDGVVQVTDLIAFEVG